jgi:hypothetical protein
MICSICCIATVIRRRCKCSRMPGSMRTITGAPPLTDPQAILLARCPDAAARARLNMEIDQFAARGLMGLLRLMFALVDYFRRDGIVWGVGRGSSCASYALFLIGVHKVDALKYDLDISEFLKPEPVGGMASGKPDETPTK